MLFLRWRRRGRGLLLRPVGVDDGVSREQQLRDGHELVALTLQALDDAREGLGRVLGGVVKQHNAPGLDALQDALCNFIGRNALPVEGVAFPNSLKPMKIKDFSKIPRVHNIKKSDLPSRSHGNVSSEKTETKRQGIKVGFCCFCAAEVFLSFFAHTA